MIEPSDDASEIPVVDRRRFDSDGHRREEADETTGGDGAAAAETAVFPGLEEWRRRAEAAEAKLAEVAGHFQRAKADLEAARLRLERDQETRVREAVGRAFLGILGALDNLDRALAHAPEGPLAEGLRLAQRQILEAMIAQGLSRLDLAGNPFDPALAEAVMVTAVDDPAQDQVVLEELRPGYSLGGRTLRPAQVRVGSLSS